MSVQQILIIIIIIRYSCLRDTEAETILNDPELQGLSRLIDESGQPDVLLRHSSTVMSAQSDLHLIINIEPLGMMIDPLCL